MMVHAMLKAFKPHDCGRRVNWWFTVEMPESATYGDLNQIAQGICDQRGWSLINARTVPEESCLDGMERQRQYSQDSDQIANPAQPLP